MEHIFTLGGEALPISARGRMGEKRVNVLAQEFAAKMGLPDKERMSDTTKTIDVGDGYCDVDGPFC
ncbi:hypothetical protein ACFQI7_36040 [Paenibacillus allorhizosphaerae]|uniref:Uncharacterized protein n=1 Tax=Paenibacillus allorhizosphaerae TaxID=2849866 RepID=A0ABN7U026_9BACL|nr:hypothetical protein [Paenibacillus allorhizosphaerae]CAG7659030.1 hypothetical protein PAECIP111802_07283 [Paenibacillus allorhizosphaerae]